MSDIMKTIKENDVKFVDLRFTDPKGKEQHVTLPASAVDESLFTNGERCLMAHLLPVGRQSTSQI